MSISRRSFFKGGVISAFVVGIPKWALGQGRTVQTRTVHPTVKVSPKEPSAETPDLYSMAMFAPFLNTEFFIQGSNNQHIPLMLTGVVDLRDPVRDSSAIAAGKECFALEFQSSPAYQIGQDTYVFRAPFGEFSLMISPMKAQPTFNRYEAVINQLVG